MPMQHGIEISPGIYNVEALGVLDPTDQSWTASAFTQIEADAIVGANATVDADGGRGLRYVAQAGWSGQAPATPDGSIGLREVVIGIRSERLVPAPTTKLARMLEYARTPELEPDFEYPVIQRLLGQVGAAKRRLALATQEQCLRETGSFIKNHGNLWVSAGQFYMGNYLHLTNKTMPVIKLRGFAKVSCNDTGSEVIPVVEGKYQNVGLFPVRAELFEGIAEA